LGWFKVLITASVGLIDGWVSVVKSAEILKLSAKNDIIATAIMAFLIGLLAIELLEIGALLIILSSINQLADTTLVFYLLLTPLSAYFFQKYNAKK
jgi:hypothetical protein